MTDDEFRPVAVSRRICAPAHDIFLTDLVRHPDFDGSQMLRGAGSAAVISGVGEVFVMKMYFSRIGDYESDAAGRWPVPPIGRVGQASDVAAAAVFYASHQAGFITGTTLLVDGGMTAGYLQRERNSPPPPVPGPHA